MQLSLIPDIVAPVISTKKATAAKQLSLNVLGSVATVVADKKPKQALTKSEAWYNGKLCTVVKRFTEDFDGLIIKLCAIKTQSGEVLEVPENHITVL